jgi:hypothetical protein
MAGKRTHGDKGSPEWIAWQSMKARCYQPRSISFKNYGARGITVCDRWVHSYENFLADMGRRPSVSHSLDRIDPNGNYEPGNCRWATTAQQAVNKRNNKRITFEGRALSVREWADKTGIPAGTLYSRFKNGWEPARALTAPNGAPPRKRGPVSESVRAALSAGQRRRHARTVVA